MIVYKVVKKIGDRYYSALVSGEARVEYRLGEWVQAPEWLRKEGYHLLVSKNFGDAYEFQADEDEHILKCEVEHVIDNKPPMLRDCLLDEGVMEEDEEPARFWVKGYMAEWVKPVEEVM